MRTIRLPLPRRRRTCSTPADEDAKATDKTTDDDAAKTFISDIAKDDDATLCMQSKQTKSTV